MGIHDNKEKNNSTHWKLKELTQPIESENNFSWFVNAFVVEGNHLVIFCNLVMMTTKLDDFRYWDTFELLIVKTPQI